ncbi:DUF6174 domain-containing protein [Streptomyces longispororuber]|uniref:DUF6174 domain-containing protein n=1 Tax=Streptomyces longispororuber TaxID=68230 RepID=UPI003701ECAE
MTDNRFELLRSAAAHRRARDAGPGTRSRARSSNVPDSRHVIDVSVVERTGMTAVRTFRGSPGSRTHRRCRARRWAVALLAGSSLWATAACGDGSSAEVAASAPTALTTPGPPAWKEPSAYAYTLTSSEGERALLGTFRVTVRDGEVVETVGLDDSARRFVRDRPDRVPTLGDLVRELAQARRDKAHTAEAAYAADGHPARITLDWDRNAVDDEARYVVSSYKTLGGAAQPNE